MARIIKRLKWWLYTRNLGRFLVVQKQLDEELDFASDRMRQCHRQNIACVSDRTLQRCSVMIFALRQERDRLKLKLGLERLDT